LHRAAHKYDIGIYFEANGHGTFLAKHEKFDTLGSILKLAEDGLKLFQGTNEEQLL
jgi:hypothetical protein